MSNSDDVSFYRSIDSVQVPTFMYGTAWKEDETERLTLQALEAGFRGIDTANQRRHYYEAGVGHAIKQAFGKGLVDREELFLQTKFTFLAGQDHRLPYDKNAPISTQVQQSFASSLEHLGVDRLDSYVLHGPSQRFGLGDSDYEAWDAMEQLQIDGRTRFLGVSNVSLGQLQQLFEDADVAPAFVQNRCFARQGWDLDVREFCRANDIVYQGFSLLTANPGVFKSPKFREIVERVDRTPPLVVFRFALQVGMIPLTGTTDLTHMKQDLGVYEFELTGEDVELIEDILT